MKKPLYSPWRFEITNFGSSFCLLPQVILYTQAPENQKSSMDANQIFLARSLICRDKRQFTPNNFNETFYEDLAVLTKLFRANYVSFPILV